MTAEDYGRIVEKLKLDDAAFAERLKKGVDACPAAKADAKKQEPKEGEVKVAISGTYHGSVRAGSVGGNVTIRIQGGGASGVLSAGGKTFQLHGNFRPPKTVGLNGKSGADYCKVMGSLNADARTISGSIDGSINGKPFGTSFAARR